MPVRYVLFCFIMLLSLSYRIQHTFTFLLRIFLLALGSRDVNQCATDLASTHFTDEWYLVRCGLRVLAATK